MSHAFLPLTVAKISTLKTVPIFGSPSTFLVRFRVTSLDFLRHPEAHLRRCSAAFKVNTHIRRTNMTTVDGGVSKMIWACRISTVGRLAAIQLGLHGLAQWAGWLLVGGLT